MVRVVSLISLLIINCHIFIKQRRDNFAKLNPNSNFNLNAIVNWIVLVSGNQYCIFYMSNVPFE